MTTPPRDVSSWTVTLQPGADKTVLLRTARPQAAETAEDLVGPHLTAFHLEQDALVFTGLLARRRAGVLVHAPGGRPRFGHGRHHQGPQHVHGPLPPEAVAVGEAGAAAPLGDVPPPPRDPRQRRDAVQHQSRPGARRPAARRGALEQPSREGLPHRQRCARRTADRAADRRGARTVPAAAAAGLVRQRRACRRREGRLLPVVRRTGGDRQPARDPRGAAPDPPGPDAVLGRRRPLHGAARGSRSGADQQPPVVRGARDVEVPGVERRLRPVVPQAAGAAVPGDVPRLPGQVDGAAAVRGQAVHAAADRPGAGAHGEEVGPDPHPHAGDGPVLPRGVPLRRRDPQPGLPA